MLSLLIEGYKNRRIWLFLSFLEIKNRYVGSFLGPFWITISQIVLVFSIGYIYGGIFNIPPETYMPFLTCGFCCWNLINGCINEGSKCFSGHKEFLNELCISPMTFIYKVVFSNLIIFFHNFFSIFFIFYLTKYPYSPIFLLSLVGVIFILINAMLVIATLATISERFRDIPSLVTNIMQISFFVTPIIWDPISFKSRAIIILKLNPFWYFISAARDPLLGRMPELNTYYILLAITAINFLIARYVYKKFSKRIIYWMQ